MKKIQKKWMLFIMASVVAFLGIGYTLTKGTRAYLTDSQIKDEIEKFGFLDTNFYKCVLNAYNEQNSSNETKSFGINFLTEDDLKVITELNCDNLEKKDSEKISDVTGLEKLTELTKINLSFNKLTKLDVSNNALLTEIVVNDNLLTELIINVNENDINNTLKILNVNKNMLVDEQINIGKYVALEEMYAKENSLIDIDVTQNTKLLKLDVSKNKITSLKVNFAIKEIDAFGNRITALDISESSELEKLVIYANDLKTLDISGNEKIKELNLSSNSNLTTLTTGENKMLEKLVLSNTRLGNLSLDKFSELVYLSLENIGLTTLDVANNTKLEKLYLDNIDDASGAYNTLTSLDVRNNTLLKELTVNNNDLNTLTLGSIKQLIKLEVKDNNLTHLNVTNNKGLERLVVSNNVGLSSNFKFGTHENLSVLLANNIGFDFSDVDFSVYPKLTHLHLNQNNITSLDVSSNELLEVLMASNNKIRNLDLTNNPNLTMLYVSDNGLSNLNLEFNKNLTVLDVSSNYGLTVLDLSKHEKMKEINTSYDTSLEVLDLSKSTRLEKIDVLYNSKLKILKVNSSFLKKLMVYDTNLTNLDLSNCSGLEEINVRDNKLIKLNVNSSSLKELHAENNSLVSLDLSSSSKLEYLSVFNNNLKELNVRSQQLKTLLAYNNLLEKLDVSRTLKLETLEVQDNNLTTLKIDSSNLLKLNVANNNLTELNIWRSSKIEELLVNNNRLSKLILNDTLNNFSEESINLENNNFVSVDGYRIDNGNIYIDANDKFDLSDFEKKFIIVDNDNVEYKLSGLKTEDNCYTNDKGVQVCNPKYYVVPGTELKAYYVIKYQQKEEKPTIDETSGNETGDAIEIVDKLIKIEVASILFNSDFDYYFNGDFSYDDKDDIIWNVKAGTTIAEFKNMITINSDSDKRLSLKLLNSEGDDITDDNDSLIKTGDKVQIFRMSGEGQILSKFDISVKGDVNGDSIFDAADLLLIMRHIINKNLINEKVLSLSADYDMNGIINLNDLIKMVKYFSGDGDDNE